jgi:tRNA pseudouridine32 synthase/23S rRNA pseudouridine746 synthase
VKSRLYLSKLDDPPRTTLDYLISHFPQIPADVWRKRVASGLVTLDDGTTLNDDTPYRHGTTVLYQREISSEPTLPEEENILYQNGEILVADKPHGMPVTPAGEYVERSLLVRLQKSTGLATLTPAHRLDRETAGVVLFTVDAACRGRYQRLFSDRAIEREYLAVARVEDVPAVKQWHVENRIGPGVPWFRQQIVDGPANAITDVELLELQAGLGLFRIMPKTGKTHQLRLHMATIGFPIVGDQIYPEIRKQQDADPPLQLLARRLAFTDPLSGEARSFVSLRSLLWRWDVGGI